MEFGSFDTLQLADEQISGPAELGPGYNYRTFAAGERSGPQCSGSSDFCFFCAFRDAAATSSDSGEGPAEDVTSLHDLIDALVAEKKELPTIVNTVHEIYDRELRKDVTYINPDTGMTVVGPEWSRDSINRHLLFSNRYPQLFDQLCSHIYSACIIKQNDRLVNLQTGAVDEENRRALMDTMKNYTSWRVAMHRIGTGSVKKIKQ